MQKEIKAIMMSIVIISNFYTYNAWANDDERQQLQQQQQFSQLQQQEQLSEHTQIRYTTNVLQQVQDNEYELTQAIFISINKQDWQALQYYVERYQNLSEYSDVMVNFAYGSLAREKRQYKQAEQYFRKMVQSDPDFVRGQLELARILFENQKNSEAQRIFQAIYNKMPKDIQTVIDVYLNAIQQRQNWQGSLSVGTLYQSNVNQKSGAEHCYGALVWNGEEICTQRRQAETAKKDQARNFNIHLSKPIIVDEQHRLLFKGLSYGTIYDTESKYSNQTANLSAGYSFKNATQEVNILPFYEYYRLNSRSLYDAYGLSSEYRQQLSAKTNINFQIDYQYNQFKSSRQQDNNGRIINTYTTMTHQVSPNTIVFGGLNYAHKQVGDTTNSFQQYAARLGMYRIFNNRSALTALAMYKKTHYKQANLFIDPNPAKNKEQSYVLTYAMPNLKFKGFYPVLGYKYSQVDSNIDWFYSYKNQELSIKMQKIF